MRCERLESPAPLGPRVGRGTGPPCYPAEKRRSPSTGQMTPGDPARGVLLHTPGVREPETGSKSLKTGSQSLIRPASFVPYFFNRESDNISAFEFQDTGLLKKRARISTWSQSSDDVHNSTDPQSDVARATRLGRHLRSRFRCSMCSAVRMD